MSRADWSALSMAESIFWPVSARSFRPICASKPCTTSLRFLSRSFFSISWRFCTAWGIRVCAAVSVLAGAEERTVLAAFFFIGFLAAFLAVFFAAGFRGLAVVFFFVFMPVFAAVFFLAVFFFVPFFIAISY